MYIADVAGFDSLSPLQYSHDLVVMMAVCLTASTGSIPVGSAKSITKGN